MDLTAVRSFQLRTKTNKCWKIMRLTAVFLFAASLHVAATGLSQKVTLNVKNAPLKTVFVELNKQTGYNFLYADETLAKASAVTLKVKDVSLADVLALCFKDQPLGFTIENNSIVIKSKIANPTKEGEATSPNLPLITITGRLLNESSEPVPGASIKVKGTTNGTTTNANGEFTLTGVDENATLVFSGTNIESFEKKIGSSGNIGTLTAKIKVASLNEVVINKGYYTEKQKYSVGNVSTITAADIEKQPVQNPLLALQGRVPGLVVTQLTGMNGGGVQVRIQGQNSFRADALEPLIVIDGVPYPSKFPSSYMETVVAGGSPLNYINPSDIESISILKDADATAIYGSRAGNGAILITTKRGKSGKGKFTIDIQQGWGKVTRFAKMMNTRQYLDMRYEAYRNDGINLGTQSIGFNNYDLKLWDTTRYTNWQKELIGGTAHYTNSNVSYSGGSTVVQYLIGANFNRQTTVFPNDYDDKAGGVHFNLTAGSSNTPIQITLSGSYNYNKNRLPAEDFTNNAILLAPNAPKLFNGDGSLNWEPNAAGSSTWNNPLARSLYTEFKNTTKNLLSNINIVYKISPILKFNTNIGYSSLTSDLFQGLKLEYVNPESRPFFKRKATFGMRNLNSWIIEPQFQLNTNIGKGKFDALLGATLQKSNGKYIVIEVSGQSSNELLNSVFAGTSINSPNIGASADFVTAFNGLFGKLNYNYKDKYIANFTGRRDGSSKFGEGNKFHNFWSVGAGWIFSEEHWIRKALPFLNFGKLRASYGTTGNDQIDDYSYLSLYDPSSPNIPYQGLTGLVVNRLPNPNLQWEEIRKAQIGIDLAVLDEKIVFGLTYVRNRSSNQLIKYTLPDVTGFNNFVKNFPATIQNTSWEIVLNTTNVKSKLFSWNTNFNLTLPQNKVINFPGIELTSYASGLQGVIIGQPIGITKLYEYAGVDALTGGYMVFEKDGTPALGISPNAIQSHAVSVLPKLYGGLSNTLRYKGFQLDFIIQFVLQKGLKDLFYNSGSIPPGAYTSALSNQPQSVLGRWQKPGDNSVIARFTTDRRFPIIPFITNEGYSYDAGSYLRLKNVTFSWQLPIRWLQKISFQNAQIYFRGQNLATITKYSGLDPESRSNSVLPPLQLWSVGVKLDL